MGIMDFFRKRESDPIEIQKATRVGVPTDMDFDVLSPTVSLVRPRISDSSPTHDLFASAVDYIAHSISAVPVDFRTEEGFALPPDHPAAALLKNTAPERSISEMIRELVKDYYYNGHGVIVVEKDRLVRIPSAYVQIELNRADGGIRFQNPFAAILVSGRRIPYERVIHIRRSTRGVPWEIRSIAAELERERTIYQTIIVYLNRYIQNGGLTPFLLISDFPRNEKQMREFRELWKSVIQPHLNLGVPPMLDRVRVERLGNSIRDMGLMEAIQILEIRICQALGVPPTLLNTYIGITNASYANMRTAMVQFKEFTLIPMIRMIEEAFQSVISRFWPDVRVVFETGRLEAMMSDREETARLFERGIITRNEARQEIGYPPLAEDEEPPPSRQRRRGGRPRSTDPTAPARVFEPDEYDDEVRRMAAKLAREEIRLLKSGVSLEEVVDRMAGRWAELMRRIRPDLPIGSGRAFAWKARANQSVDKRVRDLIQFALNGNGIEIPLFGGENGRGD